MAEIRTPATATYHLWSSPTPMRPYPSRDDRHNRSTMDGRSDAPRWTDHDLAVLVELAYSTGWHRRRLGLPEDDGGLSFVERCWRRLAWLRTCSTGGDLWAGIDEPGDLEQMRGLPPELRHLRRPRGGAA